MGDSPMSRPTLSPKPTPSLTPVLLIWLTPQLLSLLLSALRVPLSAHPPRPVESVAAQQMIVVQIAAAALFAPILFRSAPALVACLLSAAPMLQLAGFLSSTPLSQTTALYLLGGSWALMIGCVSRSMGNRQKLHISAAATSWAIGGLVLAYLNAEFAPQRALPDFLFGPAFVAIKAAGAPATSPTLWVFVGTFVTLGLATACVSRARRHSSAAA